MADFFDKYSMSPDAPPLLEFKDDICVEVQQPLRTIRQVFSSHEAPNDFDKVISEMDADAKAKLTPLCSSAFHSFIERVQRWLSRSKSRTYKSLFYDPTHFSRGELVFRSLCLLLLFHKIIFMLGNFFFFLSFLTKFVFLLKFCA